jgi:hypothetical protein
MLTDFLAYNKDNQAVETVMRMHAVKRWHMIDTTRVQTLAEHSANVALLAMMIAKTAPIEWFDTFAVVAAAALVHDVPETFTGDIPSHTKRHLDDKLLGDLENAVTHPVFNVEINHHTKRLIKLCDIADGIRFIRLHGVDLTAAHARAGLEKQLKEHLLASSWPPPLFSHVHRLITTYAYETV